MARLGAWRSRLYPAGDYSSHLAPRDSDWPASEGVTPTKDDSNTFVLWCKFREWLKMPIV